MIGSFDKLDFLKRICEPRNYVENNVPEWGEPLMVLHFLHFFPIKGHTNLACTV